jgi:GxxExxY protein
MAAAKGGPDHPDPFLCEDVCKIIYHSCRAVLKELGTGISELGYNRAVRHALQQYSCVKHTAEQCPVPIVYHKENVETMRIDLVVTPLNGPLYVLEFKALTKCLCDAEKHQHGREWFQLKAYLRHYQPDKVKVGALINFMQTDKEVHVCVIWEDWPPRQ